jgi:hypothetical protein
LAIGQERRAQAKAMRRAAFLAAMLFAAPAHAQSYVVTATVTVEEWVEAGAERLVATHAPALPDGAAYGPFRVLDEHRAALVDATDAASPGAFRAMLRDHPGIAAIEMIECPGTDDDTANLALGRMIRAARIATHVPANGSVRSGAVELFLAGAVRSIEDGAEFAVHAWRDSDGREPGDFAADSTVNRAYLDYYRQMGLADAQAFYDMTNAVPNAGARWLTAQDMRRWIGEAKDGDVTVPAPSIAHLDLGTRFP